jgi:hypothetical protein
MINKHRGEVEIRIDGHERLLRPTMDAIVKWEGALDRGTLVIARDLSMQTLKTTEILAILEAGSTDGLSRSELAAEVDRNGVLPLYTAALELVRGTLERGAEPQSGEAEAARTTE